MKLKNKMLFIIGTPILLAIILLTIVSYTYSRSLLVNESKETMLAYAGKYASDIETIISEKKVYVEASANTISKDQKRDKPLLDDLTYLVANVAGGQDFFVGFNDKTFVDGAAGWLMPPMIRQPVTGTKVLPEVIKPIFPLHILTLSTVMLLL